MSRLNAVSEKWGRKVAYTSTDRPDSPQILPLPLKRRPDHMNHYSELILERMRQLGW